MGRFDARHFERLLNPDRKQWQDPEAILDKLDLRPGMVVADVGSGPGFFTLPAARKVGRKGKVYAIDVAAEPLEYLKEKATSEGITNVEVILSNGGLSVSGNAVDVVLMANVLHETEDPGKMLREVGRILRPTGSLAIVEWKKEQQEKGPPLNERMAPEEVAAALKDAGFQRAEPIEVGPYHYGLLARKAA